MSHKGELQTLTKLSMRHQVCSSETCCTITNQHDILKTAVADASKGKTDILHKGELQTFTTLSMRYQFCPSETYRTIISESTITILMSRGRSNCGVIIINSETCWDLYIRLYLVRGVFVNSMNVTTTQASYMLKVWRQHAANTAWPAATATESTHNLPDCRITLQRSYACTHHHYLAHEEGPGNSIIAYISI